MSRFRGSSPNVGVRRAGGMQDTYVRRSERASHRPAYLDDYVLDLDRPRPRQTATRGGRSLSHISSGPGKDHVVSHASHSTHGFIMESTPVHHDERELREPLSDDEEFDSVSQSSSSSSRLAELTAKYEMEKLNMQWRHEHLMLDLKEAELRHKRQILSIKQELHSRDRVGLAYMSEHGAHHEAGARARSVDEHDEHQLETGETSHCLRSSMFSPDTGRSEHDHRLEQHDSREPISVWENERFHEHDVKNVFSHDGHTRPHARSDYGCDSDSVARSTFVRSTATPVVVMETPKLNILEFDGKVENYPFFKSQVEEARRSPYHSESKILAHLKTKLKGAALDAVRGCLMCGGSLDDILTIIARRFGNPRVVVKSVVDKLLNRDAIKAGDLSELLSFLTEVENASAILKALGYGHELDSLQSLHRLVSKLPLHDRERWGEFARKEERSFRPVSFNTFCEFLVGLSEDRQFTPSVTMSTSSGRKLPRKENYAVKATVKTPSIVCHYCERSHPIRECSEFLGLSEQERWDWITKNKRCAWCLRTGHNRDHCQRKWRCGVDDCNEKHHKLLHRSTGKKDSKPDSKSAEVVGMIRKASDIVLLKTIVVEVFNPVSARSKRCVALLDEGSSITLLSQQLADDLNLKGRRQDLQMQTMNGVTTETVSLVERLKVRNVKNGRSFDLHNTYTVPTIPVAPPIISNEKLTEHFPKLEAYDLPAVDEAPTLLIGIDHAHLVATRELRPLTKNGPYLQLTQLGWAVTGPVSPDISEELESDDDANIRKAEVHHVQHVSQSNGLEMISSQWTTEDFGCKYNLPISRSREDRIAEQILESEVHHDGERWVAPLLWRDGETPIPSSYTMARKRAINFEKKLDKPQRNIDGNSLTDMVYAKMQKMLDDGHFRLLSEEERKDEPQKTWYLPLHAVTNPNKPGKVRLVLDAAAKSHGKCLNDFLLPGPDLFNSIPGILLRWREKRIALTSDVVAMFSQVKVADRDRPAQRFLWRGKRREGEFDVYESPRLMFGATSSPSTAEFCYRKTAETFASNLPEVKRVIQEDTYVDDILTGVDNDQQAVDLISNVSEVLKKGGFELAPWVSNREELSTSSVSKIDLNLGTSHGVTRALGVFWHPSDDVILYKGKIPTSPPTKRIVLSVAMAVFDPIGFLCGWLLQPKIIMQQLWRRGLDWDDPLPTDLADEWERWLQQLQCLGQVATPRFLFDHEAGLPSSVELHVFCDASEKGFASVAYYLWQDDANKIHTSFVCAKARLAPLKLLSIPRLELQAALLAARLTAFIQRETRICISSVSCWSDSKNVLAWIRATDRRFHTFVANRVSEIHDHTEPQNWRYVPTSCNPADGASRGHQIDFLREEQVWSRGPAFLSLPEESWPREDGEDKLEERPLDDMETKVIFTTSKKPNLSLTEAMPDASRFSRWTVAVRTVARILRVLNGKKGDIDAEEIAEAEQRWICLVQETAFAEELADLRARGTVAKNSSLYSLNPVLVDGLICVDTRLRRSSQLSTTVRFPPILSRNHSYTRLLIQHLHEKMCHRAHDAVQVELRQRCWVPQARSAIRKVVRECQQCKILKAQPQSAQMAPLPKCRVNLPGGVFVVSGLDYFGPMLTSRGRATVKSWGVIFRCLATRAVHLDLVDSLDTDAALMAISRFQALRGNVRELWSDNGTNFTSADKELKANLQALDNAKIKQKLALNGVKWRFNAPGDPQAGGAWERNVRTVKETLKAILKEQRPKYDVLRTLLCEVERVLNSTPLFHVPVDATDDEVLTPYHFLIGRSSPSYPPGVFEDGDVHLRRRWRQAQCLADHFWRRWLREYLPTLSCRVKWREDRRNLMVDDVVMIADEQHPRGYWPKGIVQEVIEGPDGRVRSAIVKTKSGRLRRPVRKLIVLEASTT